MLMKRPRFRRSRWHVVLVFAVAAACSLAVAQNREPTGSAANAPGNLPNGSPTAGGQGSPTSLPSSSGNSFASGSKPVERLREGTRLTDVVGTFQSIGNDNVSFSLGGNKDSFRVLENLALQRINQVLDENRGPRQWIVSGLMTEYRGSNYLLVTKAVIDLKEGDSAASR
jgi:hypothetical protein